MRYFLLRIIPAFVFFVLVILCGGIVSISFWGTQSSLLLKIISILVFIFFIYLAVVTFKFFVKRGIISGYAENYRTVELDNLKPGQHEDQKYLTPNQLLQYLNNGHFKARCFDIYVWSTSTKNLCKEKYFFYRATYAINSLHLEFGYLSIHVENPELISVAPPFIKVQRATKVKVEHTKSNQYFTAYTQDREINVDTNDSSILPKSVNYEAALYIRLQ